MNEKELVVELEKKMNDVIGRMKSEINKFGVKSDDSILRGITFLIEGDAVRIDNVASVVKTDSSTVTISPWNNEYIKKIICAINDKNIGVYPKENGNCIIVKFPPVTEQRRKELVKYVNDEKEKTKVVIRGIRRDFIKEMENIVKDSKKNGGCGISDDKVKNIENSIQKTTDLFIKKVDEIIKEKENSLMNL